MPQDEVVRSQIGENLRFYGDMRFKQLTLLMAWLTLAGAAVVGCGTIELAASVKVRTLIACISMLFTGVLWVMEVRATLYWAAHFAKAPELWPPPKKSFWRLLTATNVVLFLYSGVYALWLWLGLAWCLSLWCGALFAVLLLALIVFSVKNYRLALTEKNQQS
ncbi:hypothetical protein LCGC14_0591950 [marine sediment metagenome]|uniref:Uncharacterized protein n=1 Tax=marine sediment metagenome TaxID=412755 RepID=A0A0F9RI78_9ZZZZ|nr:hypothetical protein [Candidatus Aminicenantes bacterium]